MTILLNKGSKSENHTINVYTTWNSRQFGNIIILCTIWRNRSSEFSQRNVGFVKMQEFETKGKYAFKEVWIKENSLKAKRIIHFLAIKDVWKCVTVLFLFANRLDLISK